MDREASNMEEFIATAIARTCNLERSALTPQARNFDIGMDCLAIMSVMSQLQAAFGVQFGPSDARQLFAAVSVDELIMAIRKIVARHQDSQTGAS